MFLSFLNLKFYDCQCLAGVLQWVHWSRPMSFSVCRRLVLAHLLLVVLLLLCQLEQNLPTVDCQRVACQTSFQYICSVARKTWMGLGYVSMATSECTAFYIVLFMLCILSSTSWTCWFVTWDLLEHWEWLGLAAFPCVMGSWCKWTRFASMSSSTTLTNHWWFKYIYTLVTVRKQQSIQYTVSTKMKQENF